MKTVSPKVFLIGETKICHKGLEDYLRHIGAPEWRTDALSSPEKLVEVYGRVCYKSFKPGLNPNVTKVREGNAKYLKNIIESGHGSVLEHPQLNFIFTDVSRVLTHELVRHRVGVGISQESLRYVRLDSLSTSIPTCIQESEQGMAIFVKTIEQLKDVQRQLAEVYEIEGKPFSEKKKLTSAFRRVAPIGLATAIGWSCNFRTLRHVLEMRTAPSAEEEIRILFAQVFDIVRSRYGNLLSDYDVEEVDGLLCVKTKNRKV